MKFISMCLTTVFVLAVSSPAGHAASSAKGKPTYESCNALASQRGFGPESGSGSRPAAKRDFMAGCMAGKIK